MLESCAASDFLDAGDVITVETRRIRRKDGREREMEFSL